jgi:hypothetical protein
VLSRAGGRVAGLFRISISKCVVRRAPEKRSLEDGVSRYLALQGSDQEALEGLAGLVAVADILESLSRVLTSNV